MKMTYAEALNIAIEALGEGEAVERLEALKAQLAKRASGKHGLTKTQKENEVLKGRIVEVLANGGMTATEIGAELGISCQKASALLKQLGEAKTINKVKEGKAIRFEVA